VSLRTLLVVTLALVCGGAAALGVKAFVRNQPGPSIPMETVQVVFAAGDISRLASLASEHLVVRDVPKDSVPKGALLKLEDAVGRVALAPVAKNDYILEQLLSRPGAGRGAAAAIPRGMRAFMIPTAKLAGAASGFLQPGDRVDVLLHVKPIANQIAVETTKVLLSRIEVFAVDQTLEPANGETKVNVKELRSVTLLVTPPQAVQLTSGMAEGVLQLTLRNADDENTLALPPAPASKEIAKKVPVSSDAVHTLNIYNGTHLQRHEVRTKGTAKQEDSNSDTP